MLWSPSNVVLLIRRWCTDRASATEIAFGLSLISGTIVTRNAVIGAVSRFGLVYGETVPEIVLGAVEEFLKKNPRARQADVGRMIQEMTARQVEVERVEAKKKAVERRNVALGITDADVGRGQGLYDRAPDLLPPSTGAHPYIWELARTQCRCCVGREGGHNVFCGKETATGSSYCKEHHERIWMKPRQPPERPYRRPRGRFVRCLSPVET